jgi:glucosamine 6-phosphate synthetase-like amidotransferase/phosphosugar isomerase protein
MGFWQGASLWIKKLKFQSGGLLDLGNAKQLLRIQVKTADYTVTEADSGSWFTTTGDANAINFTLPTNAKSGLHYYFIQSVDQDLTVTAGTADTLITFNDLAADSVAASTANEQIGAFIMVVANGTSFHAATISNGTTQTVAT